MSCQYPLLVSRYYTSLRQTDTASRSESYCQIKAQGAFKANLSDSAHISFNVTTYFDDGRNGEMRGEDGLCNGVDIVQNGTKQCPPLTGNATVTWTAILVAEWIPEANYSVLAKVTDGNETVVDLRTDFEMKYKDGYLLNVNPSLGPRI